MVRGCTNSGHPLIQYSIVSGIYDRFAEMRRAAMPMQLNRNLEDTVDRQAVASRSEGYVGRFSPEEREKLKDGTYDYMGLTRDY